MASKPSALGRGMKVTILHGTTVCLIFGLLSWGCSGATPDEASATGGIAAYVPGPFPDTRFGLAPGSGGNSGGRSSTFAGGTGGSGTPLATTGGTANSAVSNFWPASYDASGAPSPANGRHHAGADCLMSGCHSSTSSRNFLFGGTVYQSNGTTGAASVQVGVSVGGKVYTAYSASNGNFWVAAGATAVDLSQAGVKMRSALGEVEKHVTAVGAGCNSCHTGNQVLISPLGG